MVCSLADCRMSIERDQLQAALQALLQRLVALGRDEQWALYARAWLDGSMMRREFPDPVMSRMATTMDFVRDSQAGAGAAAGKGKRGGYEFARALEDAAWAVEYFERGEFSRVAKFITAAEVGAGLSIKGGA